MNKLFLFDNSIRNKNNISLIAGFDEAGRGPLAGPVYISGVILKPDFNNELINDSKKISFKQREELFDIIINNSIAYEICKIDVDEIDKINILESSRKGMQICFNNLIKKVNIEYVITDYMKIKTNNIPLLPLAKGDQTSLNVAASSILAKVSRDRYMIELDNKYPNYNFKSNKGYGTKKHLEAINKYGFIKGVHRLTFDPIKSILNKDKEIKLDF